MLKLHLSGSLILFCIIIHYFYGAYANNGSTKDLQPHNAEPATTPSPEWLEYQRERFSNAKDVETLRKMLDPASKLLETKGQPDVRTGISSIQKSENQVAAKIKEENIYTGATVEQVPNESKHNEEMLVEENSDENAERRSKVENTNTLSHVIKGIQYPTLRGFINFLKIMQRRWVKQSKLTFEQKLNKLKRLKNKMMHLIGNK